MIDRSFHLLLLLFLIVCSAPTLSHAQAEKVFREWDKNGDGVLEKQEVPPGPRRIFDRKDANGDGKITLEEHLGRGKPEPRRPNGGSGETGGTPTFTIKQTWAQEPNGHDRAVYVAEPNRSGDKTKTPVLIYFHGAGGRAGKSVGRWARDFPAHLVVVPQGYERGWNIQGEKSKAPDVEFFKLLIKEIEKRYPGADRKNISLVGSSNGGAYIYRLLIEVKEDLFRSAVPMVASLVETQHHDGSFWMPSNKDDTDRYDQKANPAASGRRVLYLHGTADKTVPFNGGLRFGKFMHLSAYDTANIWAKHFGYQGKDQQPADGKKIAEGLIRHDYPGCEFSFIAVEDGSHGLAPHREQAMAEVKKFIVVK